MNTLLTLDAVQNDFQQWRKLRKKRGSIPDELWQRVLPLLNQYPISKICSALSLNTVQIRSKLGQVGPCMESKSKDGFVELSLKSTPIINDIAEIKLIRKDGVTLSINSFPSHAINALIDHFLMD